MSADEFALAVVAVVALSVFGVVVPAAATGPATGEAPAAGSGAVADGVAPGGVGAGAVAPPVTDGGRYYVGQTLTYEAAESGENWDLLYEGSLVSALAVTEEGISLDTTGLDPGTYTLDGPGEERDVTFDLFEQSLSVEVSSSEVVVTANRRGYPLRITSPNLSADRLRGILSVDASVENGAVVVSEVSNEATFGVDASGLDPGKYVLNFEVPDTGVTASGSFEVVDPGSIGASLDRQVVRATRGDRGTFTVRLSNTDTATVVVGSEETNYQVELALTDRNGDGSVTVAFDTLAMLRVDDPNDAYSTVGGDSLSATRTVGTTLPEGRALEAGSYPISVRVDGNAVSGGALSLRDPNTGAMSLRVLGARGTLQLGQLAPGENAFPTRTVAVDDHVVVSIEADGISSSIREKSDLIEGTDGVDLLVARTSVGPNRDPVEVDPGNALFRADPANDTYQLVFFRTADLEAGETYAFSFTIDGGSNPVHGDVEASGSVRVVERSISIDDTEELPRSSNAVISGTAPMAAGTAVQVQVTTEDPPRTLTTSTTVGPNGQWNATVNTSGLSAGQTVQITAVSVDQSAQTSVTITAGGGGQPTTTTTTTTTSTTTTTTTTRTTADTTTTTTTRTTADTTTTTTTRTTADTTTTAMDTTTTAMDTTTGGDGDGGGDGGGGPLGLPGFGVPAALAALLAAGLLAARRRRDR